MAFDFSRHRTALFQAIVAQGPVPSDVKFPTAAAEIAKLICSDPTITTHLDQAAISTTTSLLSYAQMAIASTIGVPSKDLAPSAKFDAVMAASIISPLISIISTHLKAMAAFLSPIKEGIRVPIPKNPQDDEMSKILVTLARTASLTKSYLSIIDPIAHAIADICPIPSLGQSTNPIIDSMNQIIAISVSIRKGMKEQRSVAKEEVELQQQMGVAAQALPQFSSFFDQVEQSLSSVFHSGFNDQQMATVATYLHTIADSAAIVSLIGIDIALVDSSKYNVLSTTLKELLFRAFTFCSFPILLFRFRGDFESISTQIQVTHKEFSAMLTPLLTALIQVVQGAVAPFQAITQELILSFKKLASSNDTFQSVFDLIQKIVKSNQRFSIYNAYNFRSISSLISEESINSLMQIFNQLTIEKKEAKVIKDAIPTLAAKLSSYIEALGTVISSSNDQPARMRYGRIRGRVQMDTADMISAFKFRPDLDDTARTKIACVCCNLILTICSADFSESALSAEISVFKFTSSIIRHFFVDNFQNLVLLLQKLQSITKYLDKGQLDQSTSVVSALFLIRDEATKFFKENGQTDAIQSTVLCLKASDKLSTILKSFFTALIRAKVPTDFSDALNLAEDLSITYMTAVLLIRRSIQLIILHASDSFLKLTTPMLVTVIASDVQQKAMAIVPQLANQFKALQASISDLNSEVSYQSPACAGIFEAVKNVFTISEQFISLCRELITSELVGSQFRRTFQCIESAFSILKYFSQFEDGMSADSTSDVLPYVGLLLEDSTRRVGGCVQELVNATRNRTISIEGIRLGSELRATIRCLSFIGETDQISSDLMKCMKIAYDSSVLMILGVECQEPVIAESMKVVVQHIATLTTVSQNLISMISSYDFLKAHSHFVSQLETEVKFPNMDTPELLNDEGREKLWEASLKAATQQQSQKSVIDKQPVVINQPAAKPQSVVVPEPSTIPQPISKPLIVTKQQNAAEPEPITASKPIIKPALDVKAEPPVASRPIVQTQPEIVPQPQNVEPQIAKPAVVPNVQPESIKPPAAISAVQPAAPAAVLPTALPIVQPTPQISQQIPQITANPIVQTIVQQPISTPITQPPAIPSSLPSIQPPQLQLPSIQNLPPVQPPPLQLPSVLPTSFALPNPASLTLPPGFRFPSSIPKVEKRNFQKFETVVASIEGTPQKRVDLSNKETMTIPIAPPPQPQPQLQPQPSQKFRKPDCVDDVMRSIDSIIMLSQKLQTDPNNRPCISAVLTHSKRLKDAYSEVQNCFQ